MAVFERHFVYWRRKNKEMILMVALESRIKKAYNNCESGLNTFEAFRAGYLAALKEGDEKVMNDKY